MTLSTDSSESPHLLIRRGRPVARKAAESSVRDALCLLFGPSCEIGCSEFCIARGLEAENTVSSPWLMRTPVTRP